MSMRSKDQIVDQIVMEGYSKDAFIGKMWFGGWMKKQIESAQTAQQIADATLKKFVLNTKMQLEEFKTKYWKGLKKNKKYQDVIKILERKVK